MLVRWLVRHWRKLSVILCACSVFMWCIHLALRFKPKHTDYLPSKDTFPSNIDLNGDIGRPHSIHEESIPHKLILVWTEFFRTKNWIRNEHFTGCPMPNCNVTEDKRRITESNAVVMHERDLSGRSSLPSSRNSQQRWIWLTQETHMNFETHISEYAGVFNWTMTYRSDSDIIIPYGTVRKRSSPLTQLELEAELTRFNQAKRKLVGIRISKCNSRYTDRMTFVRKLQQFVPVDILGACGDPCETRNNCDDDFMREYKFYLSFENSHCKDYITEKFWLPLSVWNNIPVAMGGSSPADYEAVAPPHSYIHANQFQTPERLAEYLKILDKNQTLYDEYLKWRKFYEYYYSPYCDLCAALHNTSLPVKWYGNLSDWYARDKCSKKHPVYN